MPMPNFQSFVLSLATPNEPLVVKQRQSGLDQRPPLDNLQRWQEAPNLDGLLVQNPCNVL